MLRSDTSSPHPVRAEAGQAISIVGLLAATALLLCSALAAAGDNAMKRRFVQRVKTDAGKLPNAVVIDAIEAMFPNPLMVSNLLEILGKIDVTDADHGLSVGWQAPTWIERIGSRAELEQLSLSQT